MVHHISRCLLERVIKQKVKASFKMIFSLALFEIEQMLQ